MWLMNTLFFVSEMSVAPAPPPYDVPVPGTSDKSPVQSYDAFSAQNIPGQPMYQQQGMPVQPMYQPSINIVMQQQQQQQQQQQVTQVTTVVETHVVTYESFRAQKTLACLVLWFCNCPFGLVAYILAGKLTLETVWQV
jgi:hypothetical protein